MEAVDIVKVDDVVDIVIVVVIRPKRLALLTIAKAETEMLF